MEMTLKQLFDCARGKNIPAEFANEHVDYRSALRDELARTMGTPALRRRNGPEVFEILEEIAQEELPRRVQELIGMFAEVRQYGNNERVIYKKQLGRRRGKSYVTRATAAGVYETFRLDAETFELKPYMYAGAGIVDFERYLDGTEDIMDIYDILIEGLMDRIFEDIQACLISSWNDSGRPAANKVAVTAFDPDKMADMIQTVSAYGAPVIYCGPQFAAKMANGITYGSTVKMSDSDIEEFRNTGYIGKFAGAPVVVIPNSFVDEENTKLVFNPRFAYVLPAGKEKLVKVGLIGDTHFKEVENRDWSMEVQMYKKIGIGMVAEPNFWGIYYNAGIPDGGWDNSGLNIEP